MALSRMLGFLWPVVYALRVLQAFASCALELLID